MELLLSRYWAERSLSTHYKDMTRPGAPVLAFLARAGGDAADTIWFVPMCEHFASYPSRTKREKDGAPSALVVPAEAGLVLYNTCSIRDTAEQKVFNRLAGYKKYRG